MKQRMAGLMLAAVMTFGFAGAAAAAPASHPAPTHHVPPETPPKYH